MKCATHRLGNPTETDTQADRQPGRQEVLTASDITHSLWFIRLLDSHAVQIFIQTNYKNGTDPFRMTILRTVRRFFFYNALPHLPLMSTGGLFMGVSAYMCGDSSRTTHLLNSCSTLSLLKHLFFCSTTLNWRQPCLHVLYGFPSDLCRRLDLRSKRNRVCVAFTQTGTGFPS